MTTRADIIAEARTWLGTSYQHQGRLKGIAADCAGPIVCIPRALGILPPTFDINGYPREGDWPRMKRYLDAHLDRVLPAVPRGGDVLWLRPTVYPRHLAIYTFEGTIIHAIDVTRGVCEHSLDERWRRAIAGVWGYRGVTD